MGNTIKHLDSLFIVHVAADTLQVASSQPILQCTFATNAHHPHLCPYPNQSEPNFHTPKKLYFHFLSRKFVTLYIAKEAIKAYLILP